MKIRKSQSGAESGFFFSLPFSPLLSGQADTIQEAPALCIAWSPGACHRRITSDHTGFSVERAELPFLLLFGSAQGQEDSPWFVPCGPAVPVVWAVLLIQPLCFPETKPCCDSSDLWLFGAACVRTGIFVKSVSHAPGLSYIHMKKDM